MHCPECGGTKSKVLDSRSVVDMIRRRRECITCGHRFNTFEIREDAIPATTDVLLAKNREVAAQLARLAQFILEP